MPIEPDGGHWLTIGPSGRWREKEKQHWLHVSSRIWKLLIEAVRSRAQTEGGFMQNRTWQNDPNSAHLARKSRKKKKKGWTQLLCLQGIKVWLCTANLRLTAFQEEALWCHVNTPWVCSCMCLHKGEGQNEIRVQNQITRVYTWLCGAFLRTGVN